jgi:hypothetical protein
LSHRRPPWSWRPGSARVAATTPPAFPSRLNASPAAAADRGIPAVVESDPTIAVSRAAETDEAVPVVVSGSFHLLTAVHGATMPP